VIVPMALPLTILLSSVMVYGDMAEKYELSSAKSSGISFIRLLRPGLVVAIAVFGLSILASNIFKPNATEGYYKKKRNMKTNKLTFAFDEQIFNREFKDFSIRIGKKKEDGRTIDDVLIYDHTDADNSMINMIRAQRGEMYTTSDQRFLIMDLEDGYQVREVREDAADRMRKGHNAFARPMVRYNFSGLRKIFDLSEMMDLNMVNVSYRDYEMMNTIELMTVIDSLNEMKAQKIENNVHEFNVFTSPNVKFDDLSASDKLARLAGQKVINALPGQSEPPPLAIKQKPKSNQNKKVVKRNRNPRTKKSEGLVEIFPERITSETKSLFEIVELTRTVNTIEQLQKNVNALRMNNNNNMTEVRSLSKRKARYVFSLHQMYSWATVCIIFLFIGAPAGAIVRKGGFGYPLLIAIGFYLTFVMSGIIGKKLMGSGALSAEMGAWLPCMLLFPFAIYLSWRALHDNRPLIRPIFNALRTKLIRK